PSSARRRAPAADPREAERTRLPDRKATRRSRPRRDRTARHREKPAADRRARGPLRGSAAGPSPSGGEARREFPPTRPRRAPACRHSRLRARESTPRTGLRSELLLKLLLALRHPLAELLELLLAERLLRFRKNFFFLFLGVVLDHVLQHLHAAGELVRRCVRALDIGKHELVDGTVLLLRLV